MGLADYLNGKQPIIEREMQQFQERLSSHLPFRTISPEYIQKALYSITHDALIESGGKRIRPLLVYLGHDIVDGNCPFIDPLAIFPEFIHKGSVVIDGIEDDDIKMGDSLALHRKYEVPLALNAGNFVYFLPYLVLQDVAIPSSQIDEIMDLYFHTALLGHQAQALDLYWRQNNISPSEEEYLEMNCLKASSLTSSAVWGAILGGATAQQKKDLGLIVSDLATVYQLKDDLFDKDALLPKGRVKELATFFVERAKKELLSAFPHSPIRDTFCELVRYCGIERKK